MWKERGREKSRHSRRILLRDRKIIYAIAIAVRAVRLWNNLPDFYTRSIGFPWGGTSGNLSQWIGVLSVWDVINARANLQQQTPNRALWALSWNFIAQAQQTKRTTQPQIKHFAVKAQRKSHKSCFQKTLRRPKVFSANIPWGESISVFVDLVWKSLIELKSDKFNRSYIQLGYVTFHLTHAFDELFAIYFLRLVIGNYLCCKFDMRYWYSCK